MSEKIWDNCLRFIKDNVSEQSFKTWFEPIVPVKIENKVLTIQVPSQFFYEWLEEHYVNLLRKAIISELGSEGRLEYSVIMDRGDATHQPLSVNYSGNQKRGSYFNSGQNGSTKESVQNPFLTHQGVNVKGAHSNLNLNYTFDTFVEGDCNRLARSAGMAVAKKPGITSFNPLLIYGVVGLGKTHLVQAIGNEIKQNLEDKFVLYVYAEKFTNQFIEALKNNRVQEFTNFYLQVDTLILDDVQFLANKGKTQEIFFHIFNHLHQAGKQIIMTSDKAPHELDGLEERLLSRFKWGLTTDLLTPDFETRVAIIQKKIQADGITIPNEVIEYLAYSVDTNLRDLEGVLISLIGHASLIKREIDLELAKQTLKHIVKDIDTEVSVDYIQKLVSEHFKVDVEDIKSKTRKKEIVIARQVAMYFIKEYTDHSLKNIGYHFGGRDHSTVIHAVQSVSEAVAHGGKIKNSVEELKKKLKMKAV